MLGEATRVPVGCSSQISWQSAYEVGKVFSPRHRPPLPPRSIRGTHVCYRMSRQRAHGEAGRIISMNNSNDISGNRNSDLPACSTVSQPTGPPSISSSVHAKLKFRTRFSFFLILDATGWYSAYLRIRLAGTLANVNKQSSALLRLDNYTASLPTSLSANSRYYETQVSAQEVALVGITWTSSVAVSLSVYGKSNA
jgi:hypothetical protein